MKAKSDNLSDYLLSRKLNLSPESVINKNDPVLEDDDILSRVSTIWADNKETITMVIQARVNIIAERLLKNAIPEEVIVLRQAIVEVGAILGDFEAYAQEYERRNKEEEEIEEASPSPDPEEIDKTL